MGPTVPIHKEGQSLVSCFRSFYSERSSNLGQAKRGQATNFRMVTLLVLRAS